MCLCSPYFTTHEHQAAPNWTPVKTVRPRLIAAVITCLVSVTTASVAPGAIAAVTEREAIIWGYSYITVDSTWTDLTTDGRGTWVAVGGTGKLATSKDDGVNWSLPSLPSAVASSSFTSITYADNLWVALDLKGNILTSPEGLAWTIANTSTNTWTGAAYGEGLWIVFSSATTQNYLTSKDRGVTWTAQTLPYGFAIDEVAYGNGVWAAVGAGNGRVARHIATTEDGTTWDWVSNAAANWVDVEFGLGTFVALSAPGAISTSTDGRTWTEAAYPLPKASSGITWTSVSGGPDGYMAVGYSGSAGYAAYSSDAVTWLPVTIINARWTAVQADDDGFIALGYYPASGQTVVMRGIIGAPHSAGGYASSPWMQSIARPSAEVTCPTGWAPSWAQWPNGDRGGFVCDRTIALSGTHGGWMVFLGGQWWSAPDSVYVRSRR